MVLTGSELVTGVIADANGPISGVRPSRNCSEAALTPAAAVDALALYSSSARR